MIEKAYSILVFLFLLFSVIVFIKLADETNKMSMALLEEEAKKDMFESKKKHIDSH